MKVSEAISLAETFINDFEGFLDEPRLVEAINVLIDSGIKQLALEMKIDELKAELDKYRTKEVYSGF